jgi:hypothetical protein
VVQAGHGEHAHVRIETETRWQYIAESIEEWMGLNLGQGESARSKKISTAFGGLEKKDRG